MKALHCLSEGRGWAFCILRNTHFAIQLFIRKAMTPFFLTCKAEVGGIAIAELANRSI